MSSHTLVGLSFYIYIRAHILDSVTSVALAIKGLFVLHVPVKFQRHAFELVSISNSVFVYGGGAASDYHTV